MYYNYPPLSGNLNITESIQKVGRVSKWFTAEEKSWKNDSSTFLNVEQGTMSTEVNVCDIIDISFIEIAFDDEYIHILSDQLGKYMYI